MRIATHLGCTPLGTLALSKATEGLRDIAWRNQLDYVTWFCKWLTPLGRWGSGCACCEHLLFRGETVTCPQKATRLPEAFQHARDICDASRDEAEEWGSVLFGDGVDTLNEDLAAVRRTWERAHRKIKHLDRIPHLLCRLDRTGVAKRCLEQFAEVEPPKHHRVSTAFLEEGTDCRRDIEAIRPNGTRLSESFGKAVAALQHIPFDDAVAEAPHAKASSVFKASFGCGFPRAASTMRLEQNLLDVKEVLPNAPVSLEEVWSGHTRVINGPSCTSDRAVKIARASFQQRLYMMEKFGGDAKPRLPEGTEGDAGQPGDGGQDGVELVLCENSDDDDHGGGAVEGATVPYVDLSGTLSSWQQFDDHRFLMRQWLRSVLIKDTYVSIPCLAASDDEPAEHLVYQVLSPEATLISIATYEEELSENHQCTVSLQPLEVWNPTFADGRLPTGLNVFRLQDPRCVDILKITGVNLEARSSMGRWKTAPSDVEGLHLPCRA